jgi:3-hydroxyacyl-CoA dehydrogenase
VIDDEVFHMLREGAGSAEGIDKALKLGLGAPGDLLKEK